MNLDIYLITESIKRHNRLAKDKETTNETRLDHFRHVCWLTKLVELINQQEALKVSKWRQIWGLIKA